MFVGFESDIETWRVYLDNNNAWKIRFYFEIYQLIYQRHRTDFTDFESVTQYELRLREKSQVHRSQTEIWWWKKSFAVLLSFFVVSRFRKLKLITTSTSIN